MTVFKLKCAHAVAAILMLVGCSGDDGEAGSPGANGDKGLSTLVNMVDLSPRDAMCFKGGQLFEQGLDTDANGELSPEEVRTRAYNCAPSITNDTRNFNRVATFPVCSQLDAQCNTDIETAAEIVAVSGDGNTLVYSDSPNNALGFVDILNPFSPMPSGMLALEGEPTSVAVKNQYALVAVNTSADYVNVSGQLQVVSILQQKIIHNIDIGGQPDSIAVSPDGHYAVIAIENERNEELGDGVPPQLPAGGIVIVDISDATPAAWTTVNVSLDGVATRYPSDPEPEYVDINTDNVAVVTLQENNHIVLIDLASGSIVNAFSAGSVDLSLIDTEEEVPAIINQTASLEGVAREPDGVAWINNRYFATADEGDLDGGSRGFTIFNTDGDIVWSSGADLDHLAARYGHYPDSRSGNKGNEPENIELGVFGEDRFLFVNSERSSLVFVYDVANPEKPMLKQVLPAGQAPEGGVAIPSRHLLVVASEEDARADKIRSVLNIYQYNALPQEYPTLQSVNRANGVPIPWSALSGLAADPWHDGILYAVEDSYYGANRIFSIDVTATPALLTREITVYDTAGIFAALATSGDEPSATRFDALDLTAMINRDKSLNLDLEGIASASDGGFWLVSEGAGTVSDAEKHPVKSLNILLKTDAYGAITAAFTLPPEVNALQVRFGFEGVVEYDGQVYVAFQHPWEGEAHPRIGIFNPAEASWQFVFYPLNAAESQNGGWVGLSEISALGNGHFLLIERDNKAGPDAAVKRLYRVDLSAVEEGATITKTLVRDLVVTGDLVSPRGLIPEKVEGVAIMPNGDVYIVNDNDGVDNNKGETQLMNLGKLFN